MKRLTIIAAALALALPGCASTLSGLTGSPAVVADRTVLDEKAAIGAETIYYAANRAAALAIRSGVVKDPAKIRRIGELDLTANRELGRIRAAYDAGNAAGYDAAFRQLDAVAKAMLAML